MPAHLLYGDSFLVSEALKELQSQVGLPDVLEANSHRLSGTHLDPAQLRAVSDAVPFLAQYRLVVVEGLLALYNSPEGRRRPAGSSARPTTGAPRATLDTWQGLPRYISEEMPPTTLLVLLEERVSSGNILLRVLRPVIEVQGVPTPSGEGLARWIRNRIAEKGSRITPGAIRLLSQLVGGNLWTMDNELEKLALYAGDRAIEDGDVKLLVSQSKEASVFSAVDAILEGRSAAALGLMHRLRGDGAAFPYIVAMIARQLRLVSLARDLTDRGHRETDIAERLGLNQEFAIKKTREQARKHSWSSLKWLYSKLMEADLAVKQGRMDQDVALELLVSQASAPRAGSDLSLRSPKGHRLPHSSPSSIQL